MLRYKVIAKLLLSAHYTEVIVVASAEHTLGYNLVFLPSSSDNPYYAAAGSEGHEFDAVLVHEFHGLDEVLVEGFLEQVLDFIGEAVIAANLLT